MALRAEAEPIFVHLAGGLCRPPSSRSPGLFFPGFSWLFRVVRVFLLAALREGGLGVGSRLRLGVFPLPSPRPGTRRRGPSGWRRWLR